jgi:hypothetical protein
LTVLPSAEVSHDTMAPDEPPISHVKPAMPALLTVRSNTDPVVSAE